jgi:flagellar protein FlbD
MITLHRLGHAEQELHVNPDLIVTIEANPDTVIALANGSKLLVSEAPAEVAAAVRHYRVVILAGALRERREPDPDAEPAPPTAEPAAPAAPQADTEALPAPIPLRLAQEPGL